MNKKQHRFRWSYTSNLLAGFGVSIAMLLTILFCADCTMGRLSDSVRSTAARRFEHLTVINKLQAESVDKLRALNEQIRSMRIKFLIPSGLATLLSLLFAFFFVQR